MEMREKILDSLEFIQKKLELKHFYLPDGTANTDGLLNLQPYDRLLIVLDGIKNEPMSLNGELRTVRLERGDYYLIRKHIWEYASFRDRHEFFCIIPRGGYLRLVHYHIKGGQGHSPWPDNDWFHATLPETVESAFTLLKSLENPDDPELTEPLVRIIAKLAADEVRKGNPYSGKAVMTFEKIRNFVELHFPEPLSRNDIADYFNLNPSYVSQLFKQYTNHSLQDCLSACRIARAKYLLTGTDAPVKQIAEECGFNGEVYFIRRFRELAGCTPGRYRIASRKQIRPFPDLPRYPESAGPDAWQIRSAESETGR